jgi:chromate transport protein ChrA
VRLRLCAVAGWLVRENHPKPLVTWGGNDNYIHRASAHPRGDMIPTLTAFLALLLFVLPGFVLVQLQEAQRARRPSSGDLETVLRALFYAVLIQSLVALIGWTGRIYDDVRHTGAWTSHADAIALYVLVVVVAIPTIAGLLLGWLIKELERDGELKWWALALGARDARHGWDRAFEQQLKTGAVLVIHPKTPVFSDGDVASEPAQTPGAPASWRTLIGVFGKRSWVSRTPAQEGHDLWLERVDPGDAAGGRIGEFEPPRGLWISRDEIAHLYIVHPTDAGAEADEELAESVDEDRTVV